MKDMVDTIAEEYGVSRRELTVGQIEDYFLQTILLHIREKREEEKKEKEKVSYSKRNNKEIEEEKQRGADFIEKQQIEPGNAVIADFETLWTKYPRKQGKKDALRHYVAAIRKGVPYQTISDGLDRYISYIRRNGISPNYVKMGSSWFCEWSWEDDYSQTIARRGQNLSDERALQIAEEVLHGR